jgi:hypothetical protein
MTDKKPQPRPAVYVDTTRAATVPAVDPNAHNSTVVTYGAEIEIPPTYVAYDILDNPDAQREQWGHVRWLPGSLSDHPDVAAEIESRAEAERIRFDRYKRLGI